MDVAVGRTISHYKILHQLGAGGMGVVYKGVDVKLDRPVAIKFLPPQLIGDERARARLIAEGRAASALDHPNIGVIYEIDEAPGAGLFIVMAYYAGESLAARIRRGPLPIAVAIDLAIQTGEGLARAHEQKIVHRDVKPANLMVTVDGIIKILDFGIAKAQNVELTDFGVCVGTPAYMAPERVSGESVDHRCDIWSLGVVLYSMVAGRLPFDRENLLELLDLVRDAEPAPLEAPAALRATIFKALSKRPAARHQTVNQFLAELRAFQQTLHEISAFAATAPDSSSETDDHQAEPDADSVTPSLGARPHLSLAGERRQITMLSCELVNWAGLGEMLDPEQLHEVLLLYHRLCESAVQPFDGRIAQNLDAELTIQFGYPQAHEDDAIRAVTAGLQITAGIQGLNADCARTIPALRKSPLLVRVGVHTGPVIAANHGPSSKHTTVVGVTGPLAGKARELAAPDEVVITEGTYRLVQGFFSVRPLGIKQLPGSAKPVELYQVVARTSAGSRIDAAGSAGLTKLVGRERELGLLTDRWEEVKDGFGQVVLLSAEAGIGKSRLVAELKSKIASDSHVQLECRCSIYHQNSPLFPIVDVLARTFDLDRVTSQAEKFARLRNALTPHGLTSEEDLSRFAALFSLQSPETDSPPAPSQREREETLRTLLKLFLAYAAEQPLLLVVEDLHWVDPTTLDFLGLLVDQGPVARILTILTFRPEIPPPWERRTHLNHLSLGRLSPRESEAMVRRLTGGKRLPREVLSKVVGNSDGVPLFIEELTKAVLESEVLQETTQGYKLTEPLPLLTIPVTLRDSLMARLDRLGGAKEVAQLASVLGRTFSYSWLESISPLGEHSLRRHLSRLVEAELLYQQGVPPAATYTFKHALIKDAAYLSLPARARQHCHERIAVALEQYFPDIRDTQPELLAHHFADAGRLEQAAFYWRVAGQEAVRRSANVEAAAHFRKALDLLSSLPETPERRQDQLGLVIALGGAEVATKGYAASAVGDAFRQARELCEHVGESPELFDALQGLYAFHLVRAELQTSLELSGRLVELADRLGDGPRALEAKLRRGISLYTLGDLRSARDHFEDILARSSRDEPRETALRFGQDRVVACLSHYSLVLSLLGFPDRAVAANREALARAGELAHPFSLAFALLYAAMVRSLRCEPTAVREHAERLAALAQEQGFAYRRAQSLILEGWARTVGEHDEGGLEQIQLGITKTRATGAAVLLPYYLVLLADACLRVGQAPVGLETVQEGLAIVERTGERFIKAELERLQGELLIASQAGVTKAVGWLTKALETSRDQHVRLFELRTGISLARLEPRQRGARQIIKEILHHFDEGTDTPDLQAARILSLTPRNKRSSVKDRTRSPLS